MTWFRTSYGKKIIPCHFIPLNSHGETVYTLERQATQSDMEEVVKAWLQTNILRIEQERAREKQAESFSPVVCELI